MVDDQILQDIGQRYSDAWIRGPRITRLEETHLSRFGLDAETAWSLGTTNVGVFVGGCQPLGGTIDVIRELQKTGPGSRWVLVAATKKMAAVIIQRWLREGQIARVAVTTLKLPQVYDNIVLATPESLRKIEDCNRRDVAGIIVLDMLFHIHQARGMQNGAFFVRNDRPQLVADFRNAVAVGSWLPPLILLTQKAAKSVMTDNAARAYCLDAWWFVDGRALRCGPRPQVVAEATAECGAVSGHTDEDADGANVTHAQ
jgi:hypothetical protein